MFEVHITVNALENKEIQKFVQFCSSIKAKPIIIELDKGETVQQPMISKVYQDIEPGSLKEIIRALLTDFQQSEYTVKRVKVEVPLEYMEEGVAEFPDYQGQYFEWHGKIEFSDINYVKESIVQLDVHLSRNSLKGQQSRRFLTCRYFGFQNDHFIYIHAFRNKVETIKNRLKNKGIRLIKDEYEFCVYDSNKELDNGWIFTPEITDRSLQELLAFEGFLKRATKQDELFILKGSLLTRQCIKDKNQRLVQDMDFLYGKNIDSADKAEQIFSQWTTKVTEEYIDDNIKFTSFRENDFWRNVDYAMSDDFPTTNTDLSCHANSMHLPCLGLDISWNLPVKNPVPLLYHPLVGEPFEVKYTVPVPIQIAWKLHQSIVRPRAKDYLDIILLLEHNELGKTDRVQLATNFIMECKRDKIDPLRVDFYENRKVSGFYLYNKDLIDASYVGVTTPFGFDLGSEVEIKYLHHSFKLEKPYRKTVQLIKDFESALVKCKIGQSVKDLL